MNHLPPGVSLRLATPGDAAAGAHLHIACWREAYSPLVDSALLQPRLADAERWVRAWQDQLAQGPPRWLAIHDGELIGFAVGGPARDPHSPTGLELYAVYVLAAWYGTGVGQALLDQVVADQPCSLWVLEGNGRAKGFYARNGFVPDGTRQGYDPFEAWEIRMVRT